MTKRVRQAELGLFAAVASVSEQTGHDIKMVRSDVKRDFRATFALSFNSAPVADGLIFSEVQAVLTVLGNIFGQPVEDELAAARVWLAELAEREKEFEAQDAYENEAENVI